MTFGELIWGMIVFFFWFMAIWIFIQVFADIFQRRDLSGAWKAIWIVVLFVLPFLGALIYMISRPVTEQDKERIAEFKAAQAIASGYSAADEIAKLGTLRDSGRSRPRSTRRSRRRRWPPSDAKPTRSASGIRPARPTPIDLKTPGHGPGSSHPQSGHAALDLVGPPMMV